MGKNIGSVDVDLNKEKLAAHALLSWIGGKSKIIGILGEYIPDQFEKYCEPFLGGGSMFFHIKPKHSILSDSNKNLISTYLILRNHPIELSIELQKLKKSHSKRNYYKVRDSYNQGGNAIIQAARFIYLNKTCFNGIFRVNLKGEFNVPVGRKEKYHFPNKESILAISTLLKKAELRAGDFDQILRNSELKENDFIYLDPPYPPLNGTSRFTHYTSERFISKDQIRLSQIANELNLKHCKIMITNADIPDIRSLYRGWKIITLPVVRWVSANGSRHKVNELVITNYSIEEGRRNESL